MSCVVISETIKKAAKNVGLHHQVAGSMLATLDDTTYNALQTQKDYEDALNELKSKLPKIRYQIINTVSRGIYLKRHGITSSNLMYLKFGNPSIKGTLLPEAEGNVEFTSSANTMSSERFGEMLQSVLNRTGEGVDNPIKAVSFNGINVSELSSQEDFDNMMDVLVRENLNSIKSLIDAGVKFYVPLEDGYSAAVFKAFVKYRLPIDIYHTNYIQVSKKTKRFTMGNITSVKQMFEEVAPIVEPYLNRYHENYILQALGEDSNMQVRYISFVQAQNVRTDTSLRLERVFYGPGTTILSERVSEYAFHIYKKKEEGEENVISDEIKNIDEKISSLIEEQTKNASIFLDEANYTEDEKKQASERNRIINSEELPKLKEARKNAVIKESIKRKEELILENMRGLIIEASKNPNIYYLFPSLRNNSSTISEEAIISTFEQAISELMESKIISEIPSNIRFHHSNTTFDLGNVLNKTSSTGAYKDMAVTKTETATALESATTLKDRADLQEFLVSSFRFFIQGSLEKYITNQGGLEAMFKGDSKTLSRISRSRSRGWDILINNSRIKGSLSLEDLFDKYINAIDTLVKTGNDPKLRMYMAAELRYFGIVEGADEIIEAFLPVRKKGIEIISQHREEFKKKVLREIETQFNIFNSDRYKRSLEKRNSKKGETKEEEVSIELEDTETMEDNPSDIIEDRENAIEDTNNVLSGEERIRGNEGFGDKQLSAIRSASKRMRELFSRMTDKHSLTPYGLPKKVNSEKVFAIILNNVAHLRTYDAKMSRIKELAETYPFLENIFGVIENEKVHNGGYSETEAELHKIFTREEANYLVPRTSYDEATRTTSSSYIVREMSLSNKSIARIWINEIETFVGSGVVPGIEGNVFVAQFSFPASNEGIYTAKRGWIKKAFYDRYIGSLKISGMTFAAVNAFIKKADQGSKDAFINNIKKLHDIYNKKYVRGEAITEKDFIKDVEKFVNNIVASIRPYLEIEYKETSEKIGSERRTRYNTPSFITSLMSDLSNESSLTPQEYRAWLHSKYGESVMHKENANSPYSNLILRSLDEIAGNSSSSEELAERIKKEVGLHLNPIIVNFKGKEYEEWSKADHLAVLLDSFNATYTSSQSGAQNNLVRIQTFTYSNSTRLDFLTVRRLEKNEIVPTLINNLLKELLRIEVANRIDENTGNESKLIRNFHKHKDIFQYFPEFNDMKFSIVNGEDGTPINIVEDANGIPLKDIYLTLKYNTKGPIAPLFTGIINNLFHDRAINFYSNLIEHVGPLSDINTSVFFVNNNITKSNFSNIIQEIITVASNYEAESERKAILMQFINDVSGNILNDATKTKIDVFEAIKILESIYLEMNRVLGDSVGTRLKMGSMLDARGALYNNLPQLSKLEEFLEHYMIYKQEIAELTNLDPSFYKDPVDWQKRAKQNRSPKSSLDVTKMSVYDSSTKKAIEHSISLKSYRMTSDSIEGMTKFLNSKSDYFTADDITSILKDLSNIDATDGQSFRLLDSYIDIMKASGQYMEHAEVFDKLKRIAEGDTNVEITLDEAMISLQSIKPYLYGHRYVEYKNKEGKGTTKILTPIQHKNSESPLLAIIQIFSKVKDTNGNPILPVQLSKQFNTLLNAIEEYNKNYINKPGRIDVIHFEGVAKVGEQSNLMDLQDEDLTEEKILAALNKEGTIVQVDYSDYGVQQATPPHLVDAVLSLGTQFKKIVISDIDPKAEFKIKFGGKIETFTGEQIKNEYLNILYYIANKGYEEVDKMFKTPYDVRDMILEKISEDPDAYSDAIKSSIGVGGLKGKEKLITLLSDPSIADKIQPIIMKMVTRRILDHKVPGGTAFLVSSVITSEKLRIVFNEDNSIKYVETYMPAYTKKLLEKYMDPATGTIDISKIKDENVLKLVGYRVPTEDKYSMLPLKIKGFLPQNAGSTMLVPSDYIVLAGWDYDIDKLFLILPTLTENEDGDLIVEYEEKEKGLTKIEALNNRLGRISFEVLTNGSVAHKTINRGGFDSLKDMSRRITALKASPGSFEDVDSFISGKIDKISTKLPNYTDPFYDIYFRNQNVVGNALISIMAVVNAHHAVTQGKKIDVVGYDFVINGKPIGSLSEMTREENGIIVYMSKLISEYLAAAVDNAKDPLLEALGINKESVNEYITLVRAGYSLADIALFMNSPAVIEVYQRVSKGEFFDRALDAVREKYLEKSTEETSGNKKETVEITTEVLFNLVKNKGSYSSSQNKEVLEVLSMLKELRKVASQLSSITGASRSDIRKNYGSNIYASLVYMLRAKSAFYKHSDAAPNIEDRDSNVVTNTIPNPFITMGSIRRAIENSSGSKRKSPLDTVHSFNPRTEEKNNNVDISGSGYYQVYYSLMEGALSNIFSEYGIEMTQGMKLMLELAFLPGAGNDTEFQLKLNEKNVKTFVYDYIAFYMTDHPFFGKNVTDSNTGIRGKTIQEVRVDYIVNYPVQFFTILSAKKDILIEKYPSLFKAISLVPSGGISVLSMPYLDSYNTEMINEITRDWERMLYDTDQDIVNMAFDLFRYNFFRAGLAFGGNTFGHLAPFNLKRNIPNFQSKLFAMQNMLKRGNLEEMRADRFISQFVENHFDMVNGIPTVRNYGEFNRIQDFIKAAYEVDLDNRKLKFPLLKNQEYVMTGETSGDLHSFTLDIGSKEARKKLKEYNIIATIKETKTGLRYYAPPLIKLGDDIYERLTTPKERNAVYSLHIPRGMKGVYKEYEWNGNFARRDLEIAREVDTSFIEKDRTTESKPNIEELDSKETPDNVC